MAVCAFTSGTIQVINAETHEKLIEWIKLYPLFQLLLIYFPKNGQNDDRLLRFPLMQKKALIL